MQDIFTLALSSKVSYFSYYRYLYEVFFQEKLSLKVETNVKALKWEPDLECMYNAELVHDFIYAFMTADI